MSSANKARCRIDAVALAHRRIGARIGLGDIIHGVDVVDPVEGVGEAEPVEHAPGIGLVAVGEDELAARQPVERGHHPRIGGQPGEIDVVDIIEEFVRLDPMFLHQPGEGGAVVAEEALLDAPRLADDRSRAGSAIYSPIRMSISSNRFDEAG